MAAPTKLGQSVLDAKLNHIINNSDRIVLVSTFARSHSYATVVGNILAESAISGSGDAIWSAIADETTLNGANANAPNRRLTVYARELDAATSGNGGGSDMAQVLLDDGNSEILAVSDETTDRAIAISDVVTTFEFFIQSSQAAQLS